MTFVRLGALGCLALLAAGAGAQSIDDARAAYAEGRFLEAADLGEAMETSDGYALAAQSLAVHAAYVATENEWEEVVERATQMGEEAVRADSTHAQAHYQSAHAVGRYAQGVGTFTALRQGLAGRIYDLLYQAIVLDPSYAEARLALGGWHADIWKEGFIARRMYGGNRETAVELFEQALSMQPESRVVLFEYACRLPYLDEERGIERAEELMARAAQLPLVDAYDGFMQELVLKARAGGQTEACEPPSPEPASPPPPAWSGRTDGSPATRSLAAHDLVKPLGRAE